MTTDLPAFIGNYKILKKLGAGGFATVYLAQVADGGDAESGEAKLVALKALSASESYARFLREIETVANLDHPNIIRIFDTGEAEKVIFTSENDSEDSGKQSDTGQLRERLTGMWNNFTRRVVRQESEAGGVVTFSEQLDVLVPYFTMEYIAGGTLRTVLETEPVVPRSKAMNLIRQIGAALTYAHEQGVIHRDVNPNNILLDITQTPTRPVLTDFGLVKALSTGDNLTMTVGLIGTFHYYAPEQWTRATLTPATDLYALAITVFEMLAGQRPYAGDIFGLRDKHLNEALPPLSSVNADTGPFFDDVLIRATAKDPLDRYESVAEFIKALEAANLEADRDDKYRAIQALIKREDFDQALKRLDRDFIQMGQYRYRDIARLLWGVIYAQEHEGILPPEWNGSPGNRTTPFGPTEIMSDRPEFAPGQTSEKWHSVNKYVIPLALALTMLIGSSIASQIPAWLKTPTVQITGLVLLVGYLAYYTWVYYIEPFRKVD